MRCSLSIVMAYLCDNRQRRKLNKKQERRSSSVCVRIEDWVMEMNRPERLCVQSVSDCGGE